MDNILAFLKEIKYTGAYIIKNGDKIERSFPDIYGIYYDKPRHLETFSKLYYNYMAMLLFEYGKINIYQKINMIDDRFPDYISIYDILAHSSSIMNINTLTEFDNNKEYNLEEMIEFIFKYKLTLFDKTRYSKYVYSHTNNIIFVHIIQKIMGMSVRDLIKKYVINKLQLKETYFIDDNDKHKSFIKPDYFHDIIATPRDLEKFILTLNDQLSGAFLKMFYAAPIDNELTLDLFFCVSGLLHKNKGGKKGDGKSYYTVDYYRESNTKCGCSFEGYNPQNRYAIMFSTVNNYVEAISTIELARNIMMVMASGNKFLLKPDEHVPLSSDEIKKIIGQYVNQFMVYIVVEKNGKIIITSRKQVNTLIHIGGLRFYRNYVLLLF